MKIIHTILILSSILILTSFSYQPYFPSTILINGEIWQVKQKSLILGNSSINGRTKCLTKTIELRLNASDDNKVTTLIHEVMHAMTCEEGSVNNEKWNNDNSIEDLVLDHKGIYWGAPKIRLFIHDNPEITNLIQLLK